LPELVADWRSRLVKEMRRKAIHLTGLSVPMALIFLGRTITATAIALALAVSLIIEVQRLRGRIRLPEVRDHEKTRVAGYIYYMAGSLLTVLCFPSMIAITAMLFLSLGDTVSGLVGSFLKNWDVGGESPEPARRVGWRVKPLPVLAATFAACLVIGALASEFTALSWPVYLAGAAAAAFADGVAIIVWGRSLDDNFSIPVFSGAVMSAVALILDSSLF
jgi:dolichol kinase